MKQQKYYNFLQKQIIILIGLSLIPGLVYVIFGWIFNIGLPATLWYIFLIFTSIYGMYIYQKFKNNKMNDNELWLWYKHLTLFMYIIFFSWAIIFLLYVRCDEYHLHYIAIFTELGASVVASTLLVSDKKLFIPIIIGLMVPLMGYFLLIDTWYGYVLAIFSIIFLSVLIFAAYNTYSLLKKNYYQAQHDMLTGLYNRRYFMEYMEDFVQRLIERKYISYMYLIDLDHFKTINDSLGHEIGDKLLIEVTQRIKEFSSGTHMLARLGGDEFILVSNELESGNDAYEKAKEFAEGLLSIIREPYIIDIHHLHISASIGLHELNPDSLQGGNFIKEVDIAMYEAKAQGRDGVIVFNQNLSKKVKRHLLIEQKLHQALKEKKLLVYLQPQVDKNEKILGCEALARWYDDELGYISTEEFISIAENTGLILELGSYILKETFSILYSWNQKGITLDSFSINISTRQLLYKPFIEEVEYLMKRYFSDEYKTQKIFFEITEHVFAEDMKKVVSTINRLKTLGICFSIDDFGTGYSSLSYLQELPIKEIKIDKAFIENLGENENMDIMIQTIISIGKNFNFRIVAEGVETKEQFVILQKYDCDIFQGYYFDKALTQKEFEKKYLLD